MDISDRFSNTDMDSSSRSMLPVHCTNGVESRENAVICRRGAFQFLPVLCSNDLVHGSWWFFWGSVFATIVPVVPLLDDYIVVMPDHDDTLHAFNYDITWYFMLVSGIFFTLGSLAFVRAFEEPPLFPVFRWVHVGTDELLGAWLFFFGTLPSVPLCGVFVWWYPFQLSYCGALVASVIFVIGAFLFVLACYPSNKTNACNLQPIFIYIFGRRRWIDKHICNDWLAGTWFFFYATLAWVVGSIYYLMRSVDLNNMEELLIWTLSFTDSVFYLIGSVYYVAGSYPASTVKLMMHTHVTASSPLPSPMDTEAPSPPPTPTLQTPPSALANERTEIVTPVTVHMTRRRYESLDSPMPSE